MANKNGTNFLVDNGDTNVKTAFTDANGDAIFVISPSANIPSAKTGYAIGCLLLNATSGSPFVNVGTNTSCSFMSIR